MLKESFTGYHFKQALFYNADENMDEGKVTKFKAQDKIPTLLKHKFSLFCAESLHNNFIFTDSALIDTSICSWCKRIITEKSPPYTVSCLV